MADNFAEDTASLLGGSAEDGVAVDASPAPGGRSRWSRTSPVAKAAAFAAALLLAGSACVVVTRGRGAGSSGRDAQPSESPALRGPQVVDDRALVTLDRERPAKADAQALVTLASKRADTKALVVLSGKKETKDDDGSKGKGKEQVKPKLVEQTFEADKDGHGETSVEAGEWVYPLAGSESKNGWTFIYTGDKQGYIPDWALEKPKTEEGHKTKDAEHGKEKDHKHEE
mmetsp:Transcript_33157/g.83883  ORF Transcript_33157/g.83883 Transcript_33157/m.83883 type:complete len:228 (-) Transcript_33157:112-795(-)